MTSTTFRKGMIKKKKFPWKFFLETMHSLLGFLLNNFKISWFQAKMCHFRRLWVRIPFSHHCVTEHRTHFSFTERSAEPEQFGHSLLLRIWKDFSHQKLFLWLCNTTLYCLNKASNFVKKTFKAIWHFVFSGISLN